MKTLGLFGGYAAFDTDVVNLREVRVRSFPGIAHSLETVICFTLHHAHYFPVAPTPIAGVTSARAAYASL